MNVIQYDIEIRKLKRRWFQVWRKMIPIPIKKHLEEKFSNESDYTGNYLNVIQKEWDNLEQRNINNLNNSSYLIGYLIVNNIKVFLFEIINSGVTGKNNISLEIYAFGNYAIENILNDSYATIRNMVPELKCRLSSKSILYIFPYNSSIKDIESTDLKIKAHLSSSLNLSNKDYLRWCIVFIISLLCYILNIAITKVNLKPVFNSFFISGLFYIILDLIINLLIPLLSFEHKKVVSINDLSSVLEITSKDPLQLTNVPKLKIPE